MKQKWTVGHMRTAMASSYAENFVHLKSQIPRSDCTTNMSVSCINLKQAFSSVNASCFVEIEEKKKNKKKPIFKRGWCQGKWVKVDYEN